MAPAWGHLVLRLFFELRDTPGLSARLLQEALRVEFGQQRGNARGNAQVLLLVANV